MARREHWITQYFNTIRHFSAKIILKEDIFVNEIKFRP